MRPPLLRRGVNYWRNPRGAGAVPGTPGTFPGYWFLYQSNPYAGIQTNVVGQGYDGNIEYTDLQFVGTGVANTTPALCLDANNAIPGAVGQTWTFDCYLKVVAGSLNGASIYLEISEWAGGSVLAGGNAAQPIISSGPLASGLCSFTYTTQNAGCAFVQPDIDWSVANGFVYNYTIRVGVGAFYRGKRAVQPIALPPIGSPNFSQAWS